LQKKVGSALMPRDLPMTSNLPSRHYCLWLL